MFYEIRISRSRLRFNGLFVPIETTFKINGIHTQTHTLLYSITTIANVLSRLMLLWAT